VFYAARRKEKRAGGATSYRLNLQMEPCPPGRVRWNHLQVVIPLDFLTDDEGEAGFFPGGQIADALDSKFYFRRFQPISLDFLERDLDRVNIGLNCI